MGAATASLEHATRRRERVREAVAREGLDAFLIVSPASLAYVSGLHVNPMERLILLVVGRDGPLRLVAPSLEEQAAREGLPPDSELHVWTDADGPAAAVAEALAGLPGGAALGIEKDALTVAYHELLASTQPRARFADCGAALRRLRVVKDDDEIERTRAAAGIVDRAVERLVAEEVRPGRTELELAAAASRLLREEGGESLGFEPLVLAGPRSALPHGHPGPARLEEGALLIVDLGVASGGYCADITRTFVVGEASERQRELFALVDRARRAGIAAIRPGVPCRDVDRAARAVIEEAGYGPFFNHRLGHGLGLEVHEAPGLTGSNEEPLVEGMVVTVEPGVYLPELGGVRIEDDVLVTADGAEVLTRAPIGLELRL